jgi:magnesium transporter
MVRTRCYMNGVLTDAHFDADQLSEHLAEPGAVVWVDLVSPDADELARIGDELGLHQLAVEDAVHAHQRPKLDRYPDHAFLSAYAVRF